MDKFDAALASAISDLDVAIGKMAQPTAEALLGQATATAIAGAISFLITIALATVGIFLFYRLAKYGIGRFSTRSDKDDDTGTVIAFCGILGCFGCCLVLLVNISSFNSLVWGIVSIHHPDWFLAHQIVTKIGL